jgi:hypothetical protein
MTETLRDETGKKTPQKLSLTQKYLIAFVVGVLVAAIATTAIRFALIKDTAVHYHANFALYLNGQKDEFKSFAFYEEVAACNVHDAEDAKARTHMHDSKAGLIHVHDGAVTWGQFFENLGYTLGNEVVATDKSVYANGADGKKLSFMLNGEDANSIANTVIHSEDVLLISYGNEEETALKSRYDQIPRTAHEANETKDPAACSGAQEVSFWDRLKQAIGLPESDH